MQIELAPNVAVKARVVRSATVHIWQHGLSVTCDT